MAKETITVITERDHALRMSDDLLDLHLKHLEAAGRPRSTIEARGDVMRRLTRRLDYGLAYAATEQIEAWWAELHQLRRAKATIAIYQYHVQEWYLWACRAGFLDGNPTLGMARTKVPLGMPNPCSEEELALALSLAEPMRTAVILAAFEGFRRTEISKADRRHFTEDITLIPDGKGGQPAAIPTHPYVWEHVCDRPPGLLVTGRRGQPVDGHWLSVQARAMFDGLGMPEVHLHRLRKRYGTLIQELYGDIRVTQECLRHKNVSTTMIYTMVTPGRRNAAVAMLPVPGRKKAGPAAV